VDRGKDLNQTASQPRLCQADLTMAAAAAALPKQLMLQSNAYL
jgi:hypothetical protein